MGALMAALVKYADSYNTKDPNLMMKNPTRGRRMVIVRVRNKM
jgi:hypothetical protein